jgi:hypothetical protein
MKNNISGLTQFYLDYYSVYFAIKRIIRTYHLPIQFGQDMPKIWFDFLYRSWQKDTSFHSSIHVVTNHWAYQAIISYNTFSLPLIYQYLKHEPDHWFTALCMITGANPIPSQDRGYIDRMTHHWLTYGAKTGMISL